MTDKVVRALEDVASWWPGGVAVKVLGSDILKGLTREDIQDLRDALGQVIDVHDEPPEVTYLCLACGMEWTTKERPAGCPHPNCRAPNCDLSPKP